FEPRAPVEARRDLELGERARRIASLAAIVVVREHRWLDSGERRDEAPKLAPFDRRPIDREIDRSRTTADGGGCDELRRVVDMDPVHESAAACAESRPEFGAPNPIDRR